MLAPEVSDFRLERPKTSVFSYKRDDNLPHKVVSPFTDIAHIVSKIYHEKARTETLKNDLLKRCKMKSSLVYTMTSLSN